MISNKRGFLALSPLLIFLILYLVTSITVQNFYQIPITVVFLLTSIYAICIFREIPLSYRIETFNRGAGAGNIMLMLWIFILAGAFANTAKTMGCIDASVSLTLQLLPTNMLLAGMFIAACLISLSIGTSVGTIVALIPVAAGIANATQTDTALVTAIVIGGSFFGDNLSFISDTTVAATSTQYCKMRDKFQVNIFIVFPAALLIFLVYLFMGNGISTYQELPPANILKIIPYLIVLIVALCGMNVIAVLTLGIVMTGIIGLLDGSYQLTGWLQTMGDGIIGMSELMIITMLAGGLLELIRKNGGIDFLIQKLTAHVYTKRGAELSIGLLVSLVNICTANNTVAIITVGGISKQICDRYGVDNRKAASILDTFSCCVQGLLPYGAQILMASALTNLSPIQIIPHLYYPMCAGICAIVAIIFRYPKKYS